MLDAASKRDIGVVFSIRLLRHVLDTTRPTKPPKMVCVEQVAGCCIQKLEESLRQRWSKYLPSVPKPYSNC